MCASDVSPHRILCTASPVAPSPFLSSFMVYHVHYIFLHADTYILFLTWVCRTSKECVRTGDRVSASARESARMYSCASWLGYMRAGETVGVSAHESAHMYPRANPLRYINARQALDLPARGIARAYSRVSPFECIRAGVRLDIAARAIAWARPHRSLLGSIRA